MQNPEAHRETLHEMAAALLDKGLIDQLEQFEMNEMADAAYWHAVEELQISPDHYRGASTYNVVQVTDGKLLGTISRSIFNFATNEPRGASFAYDGKVYSDSDGVRLTLGFSRAIGRIGDLFLDMNGQRYRLIEIKRVISGVHHKPIDDPDIYRMLVDAAQVAQEERDLHAFKKVRPHMSPQPSACAQPAAINLGVLKIVPSVKEMGLWQSLGRLVSNRKYENSYYRLPLGRLSDFIATIPPVRFGQPSKWLWIISSRIKVSRLVTASVHHLI